MMRPILWLSLLCLLLVDAGIAQVQLSTLKKTATIELGGSPDWMVITDDAVWIANDRLKAVQRIDPKNNTIAAKIDFAAAPCSGLAFGFGSLWVPLCGEPSTLARVDPTTNKVVAILPVGPVDDEGSITASDGSVWIVSGKGKLSRIDPKTNSVSQQISIPVGSANPLFSNKTVWITNPKGNVLTALDAGSGKVVATIPVGPKPRFLTAGGGSIWVLNQGNGSVTRVDASSKRILATIKARIPGAGGEISYGADSVWATVFKTPLTRIDVKSNQIVHQWVGPGGDSVRYGHGSVWLTDLRRGLLWRIDFKNSSAK